MLTKTLNNPISISSLKLLSNFFSNKFGGYILAYHEIGMKRFEEQIRILGKNKIVSLTELFDRKSNGKSTKDLFCITVDDCYKSTLPDLCDFCSTNDIPITFFVPTDFIDGIILPPFIYNNVKKHSLGKNIKVNGQEYDFSNETIYSNYFLKLHDSMYYNSEREYASEWNQIMDQLVSNYGINKSEFSHHPPPVDWDFIELKSKNELLSFQSHGISHQPLVALSEKELRKELLDSKTKIFERTQKEVNHFCYPYGGKKNIGPIAENIVKEFYKSAVTMERGRIGGNCSPYFLPRIPLYEIDSPGRTLLKTLTK